LLKSLVYFGLYPFGILIDFFLIICPRQKEFILGLAPQISTIDNNKTVVIMKRCGENEDKNQTALGCFSFILELSCPQYSFPCTVSPS
jgi:hypothetical protein